MLGESQDFWWCEIDCNVAGLLQMQQGGVFELDASCCLN